MSIEAPTLPEGFYFHVGKVQRGHRGSSYILVLLVKKGRTMWLDRELRRRDIPVKSYSTQNMLAGEIAQAMKDMWEAHQKTEVQDSMAGTYPPRTTIFPDV